ncbi:MAG: efflux RND transporter permease subunit, partial [Woeseiaceae bacterium]
MVKLTGVNDEPSKEWDLDTGLDALEEIGTRFVELRAVDGKKVDDLTDKEFDRVRSRISDRGFTVTGYDSNLGKCELDEANWAKEEERFELAVKRTDRLDVRIVRTMGYRRGSLSVTEWHSKTLEWFGRLEKLARNADRIIVLENCHRYRLMGYDSFQSAIKGASEVVAPILSSIGTNIAAFLPLILLPGIMGKFMRIIPLVFALALLASLFEAFFLLPSHYADWTIKSQVQKRGEKKFFKSMRRAYGHLLIKVLRRRYYLLPGLVLVLILSLGLIPLIGVNMFGEEDFDQFNVLVRLPEGTSLEESDRIMRKFEAEALALPNTLVNAVVTNVGLMQGNNEWVTRKNVAQVLVQLVPKEQRTESVDDVLEMMRERVQYISGPASLQFEKITGGPPVGKPISVKVQGKYLDDVKRAALALQDSIRTLEGAYDVSDDFPPGKQEIRIIVDEEKAALYGFSTQYVAMNVRYAFDGVEATEFRDGDDEIDVIVKYDQLNRSTVDDVLNLRLTNAGGQTVAMRDMVRFEITPGPT